MEKRVILREVFFWNSTSLSFTRFTALYGGILALTSFTCSSKYCCGSAMPLSARRSASGNISATIVQSDSLLWG